MATNPVLDGLTITGFSGILKAAAGVILGSAGVADMPFSMKYGTTTFNMASGGSGGNGTGTQAITGVGFTPTVVIFVSNLSPSGSIGMDDGTNHFLLAMTSNTGYQGNANSIEIPISSSNISRASISSLDADGFTLTWTKAGSPTGVATIMYLAIKA